ncbi:DUF1800 domain-containing protein [Pseudochryseolinea flava]|uniref:DUF1800 domain-containing protein n=1 Tax=Pseudochryseolinea flava TaxID=2059302 RepID=A0A364Y3M3_9BACT|nr:DUF1800 family protein [Pseudochryseolinea flava]RAW01319.1 DUF1800 domain-containing protein [Pseudochryseolinea flava]
MSLPLYGGPWGLKQAAHLLRRATFGATKAQIDDFVGLGMNGAINALFPGGTLPAPELPIDPKTGTEWFTTGVTDANSENADLIAYFHGWFLGQMATDNLALSAREKTVWFLHTHFTAITSKISNSRSLYFQNELFRLYARDEYSAQAYMNFKELTVKVSVDNAMLRLLDGDLNVKGAVNENYARELLELYTIGRGIEGLIPGTPTEEGDYFYFTEQDVEAAARVLSGWTLDEDFVNIDPDTNLPRGKVRGNTLNASAHDNDPKVFSARFGGATIQPDPTLLNGGNPTEESALDEIRQLIELIYSNDATLRNICWKIYRFYVWGPHSKATDNIEWIDTNIISGMVQTMKQEYKILPVIKELLSSKHFYREDADPDPNIIEDNNIGALIKSPLDLTLGTMRFFNISLPDMIAAPEDFYSVTQDILDSFEEQGLKFYEPYDVAGYEAYHQYPVYHRFWITPNYLANRYNLIRTMVSNPDSPLWIDTYNFIVDNFGEEPDADLLISNIARYIYAIVADDGSSTLTEKRAAYFKAKFLNGMPEDYWITQPGAAREFTDALINIMLQTPEYQLS